VGISASAPSAETITMATTDCMLEVILAISLSVSALFRAIVSVASFEGLEREPTKNLA
jgi:hypothetical protein